MSTIIYASPHQGILNLLRQQPHLQSLCLVEQRDHLKIACDQLQPDILFVSEQLPGESSIPLYSQLIEIKQAHPSLRIIYLAGPSFLQQPQAKQALKQLHRHQLYQVHLQKELDGDLLLRYFHDSFDVHHLEAQSGFDLSSTPFSTLKQLSLGIWTTLTNIIPKRESQHPSPSQRIPTTPAFDPDKTLQRQPPSNSFKRPTLTFSSPSFPTVPLPTLTLPNWNFKRGFKKYGPPAALMGVALTCFYFSAKPVLDAKQGVYNSMSEWESLKDAQAEALIPTERPVVEDSEAAFTQQKEEHQTSNSNTSNLSDSSNQTASKPEETLLGLIKINPKGKFIGVRPGTSDAVLNKGAGLDELGVGLGQKGNTILYGHREEVFWDLKNIKIGDLITVETLSETLTYQVTQTRVTYPQDTSIYDSSTHHKLTLVTCHPFVYMGPTPERFVVEAELVD